MKLLYRLFFTREDELDLGWMILLLCALFGMAGFGLEAAKVWDISTEAWVWYGSFTTLSFIAGTTLSRARLIAGLQGNMQGMLQGLSGKAVVGPDPLQDEREDPRAPQGA